ncbi:hypothetical protein P0Y35_00685 [Kiritimatiellaeota bacterium B1221]|nr:hypothetical protein [Kiritimatiellaeota bacterium B1221]
MKYLSFLSLLLLTACSRVNPPPPVQVEISKAGLNLNGTRYTELPSVDVFKEAFGKARFVSGTINHLFIWDQQGICIFQDCESLEITTLHFSLNGDGRENRPEEDFMGTLQLLDTPVTASTPRSLIRRLEKTKEAFNVPYTQTSVGPFTVSFSFTEETIRSVELWMP